LKEVEGRVSRAERRKQRNSTPNSIGSAGGSGITGEKKKRCWNKGAGGCEKLSDNEDRSGGPRSIGLGYRRGRKNGKKGKSMQKRGKRRVAERELGGRDSDKGEKGRPRGLQEEIVWVGSGSQRIRSFQHNTKGRINEWVLLRNWRFEDRKRWSIKRKEDSLGKKEDAWITPTGANYYAEFGKLGTKTQKIILGKEVKRGRSNPSSSHLIKNGKKRKKKGNRNSRKRIIVKGKERGRTTSSGTKRGNWRTLGLREDLTRSVMV